MRVFVRFVISFGREQRWACFDSRQSLLLLPAWGDLMGDFDHTRNRANNKPAGQPHPANANKPQLSSPNNSIAKSQYPNRHGEANIASHARLQPTAQARAGSASARPGESPAAQAAGRPGSQAIGAGGRVSSSGTARPAASRGNVASGAGSAQSTGGSDTIRPQGPSPLYAGAAVAQPRLNVHNSAPSPFAGAAPAGAVAPPLIIAEIARQRAEEAREKIDVLAHMGIIRRIILCFVLVWQYKLNIMFGVLPFFLFNILANQHLDKYIEVVADDSSTALLISFALAFFGIMLMLGFVGLIAHIIERGEPDLSADMFINPWFKLHKLFLPVMGLIGLNMIWQRLCFVAVDLSTYAGQAFAVLTFSCLAPLTLCYLFFLADKDDYDVGDSIIEPLKLLAASLGGWLSLIFVFVFACAVALGVMLVFSFLLIVPIVGFVLFIFGAICSYIFVFGYTIAYAGYTYRQALARRQLEQ